MKAVDLNEELGKLTFLDARTRQTTIEKEAAAFALLASYRDGGVYAGGFSGESPWERHPNGDELVHVLDGSAMLTIIAKKGPTEIELRPGTVIVVPQGLWHRFRSDEGITVMTVTPEPTEHSTADVPECTDQATC